MEQEGTRVGIEASGHEMKGGAHSGVALGRVSLNSESQGRTYLTLS